MNVDELPETVWIAEAYIGGERITRAVQLTEEDAWEEVEHHGEDVYKTVEEERLHTGQVDEL